MGEQEKILLMINRWGYLTAEQIALLLNKPIESAKTNLKTLHKKQFYKIDKTTRKNIYTLTHKGNSYLGRVHKKSIKVNYYELPHQDMLIKWLCSQTDIEHYQTERELKMENGNLNAYPDLIVYKNDEIIQLVEFERTRKTPERFRKKLDGLRKYYKDNYQVHWITPTQTLASWIENQINNYAWEELNTYEIWNDK
ncbi:hypothetical protein [Spiroplasma endosymbiont of Glossina fuscipes fuscipes]|uniref:hypothetical protein n=1 Tax=Spiroplasma endosymbiont of Glossina fuscipes fuscipes TaxID=2004463 RepID=UPI003CFA061E